MPLIDGTGDRPGWLFRNAHASTILSRMWRKVLALSYDRQRLFFEGTIWGGHVGFHQPGVSYYSEQRALAFVVEVGGG